MTTLDITPTPINYEGEELIVPEELFGGILINKSDFYDFSEDYEELNLTFVRFPGGTFSESGQVNENGLYFGGIEFDDLSGDRSTIAYDLTFPELFNPTLLEIDEQDPSRNTYASLSEVMALCVEEDAPLAIILPTERYFNGVDLTDPEQYEAMAAQIEADLLIFLDRLIAGEYNEGIYPEPIVFEIGNEVYGSPIEYATVAKIYIDCLTETLEGSEIEYEIAFQMNVGSSQFQNLHDNGYFYQYFDEDGQALLPSLEGMNFDPDAYYPYGERILLLEVMMVEVLGDSILEIDMLRHHYLTVDQNNLEYGILDQRDDIVQFWYDSIDAAGGDSSEVDYYVSAWTTDSGNVGQFPAGMPAAANTLLLFTEFLMMGVDVAAAWGLNGSRGYWPEDSPTTVLTFSEQDGITPSAAVLGLMAENTIGTEFVPTDCDRLIDNEDSSDFLEFIFTSPDQTVLYYSAGFLDGDTLTLNIDLGEFGYFGYAEVTHIGTVDGTIQGLAEVETSGQAVLENSISISFSQDFEVIQIVVDNLALEGSVGNDTLTGTSSMDYISGNDGDDNISGWAGDDILYGDSGNDVLYGNVGGDILKGGDGADKLYGGDGFDTLYGGGGDDILYGMNDDDVIFGDFGSDSIYGGQGNDVIHAGTLNLFSESTWAYSDTFFETDDWRPDVLQIFGATHLEGGSGDDILFGGKGEDTFVFESGNDVIYGFQPGIDSILLPSGSHDVAMDSSMTSFEILQVESGLRIDLGSSGSLLIDSVTTLEELLAL